MPFEDNFYDTVTEETEREDAVTAGEGGINFTTLRPNEDEGECVSVSLNNNVRNVFIVTTSKKPIESEEDGENEDIFGFDVIPTSELEVNTEYPEITTVGSKEKTTVSITEVNKEETTANVTDTEVSPEMTTIESNSEGLAPEAIIPAADKVECSAKCEDEDYRPLCGDDGVTYSSLCHLQVSLMPLTPCDARVSDGPLPQ